MRLIQRKMHKTGSSNDEYQPNESGLRMLLRSKL